MHRVLQHQLRKLGLSDSSPPNASEWRCLLERVTRAYEDADRDRYTLERSLSISSREMHELHDAARRSEEKFKALVEGSPDAIFVRRGGLIRYANSAMARMLGYDSPAELLDRDPLDAFVHQDDKSTVLERRQAAEAGKSIRVRWIRRDGSEIAVEGNTSPIELDGAPAWLTTVRDITEEMRADDERRRVADSLRQSEERYRVLFDSSPLAVLAFEQRTLRIVAANDAAVRMYGYTRDELLAMTVSDIKVAAELPGLVKDMASNRLERWTGTRKHRRKDGTLIDASIVSHPVTVEGRVTILAIVDDVTETRQLQEALSRAQKLEAIGRLAGGIAHDFNNILAVIVSFTGLAMEELGDEHPVVADLREVALASRRGAALTKQLLMFGRRLPSRPQVLSLDTIALDLVAMLGRLIGTQVQMTTRLGAGRSHIEADPAHIEQVITNLVINARDAMPNGGKLTLETSEVELDSAAAAAIGVAPGAFLVLSVSDTGVGMDAATRERIFEPFFTTKELGRGTGLGLSTVFGLVSQCGGAIVVHSEPRIGSTFRVHFPRARDAQDAPLRHQTARPLGPGGPETILLVEDDDQLRVGLRRVLGARGYEVLDTSGSQGALQLLQQHAGKVDAVLSDVVMPGMNGRDLAEVIRARYPAVRVVLMSGYPGHIGSTPDMMDSHAAFVAKPFSSEEVLSTLRRVLDQPLPR